jgi:hypothetical protein
MIVERIPLHHGQINLDQIMLGIRIPNGLRGFIDKTGFNRRLSLRRGNGVMTQFR